MPDQSGNTDTGALEELNKRIRETKVQLDELNRAAEKASASVDKAKRGAETAGEAALKDTSTVGKESAVGRTSKKPRNYDDLTEDEKRLEDDKFERISNKRNNDQTKRGPMDVLASLLNTHNPHGSIRNVLSGNVGAWNFRQLGQGIQHVGEKFGSAVTAEAGGALAMGAIGAASTAFVLSKIVYEGINLAYEAVGFRSHANQVRQTVASERMNWAIENRFRNPFTEEEILKRHHDFQSERAKIAEEMDKTSGFKDDVFKLIGLGKERDKHGNIIGTNPEADARAADAEAKKQREIELREKLKQIAPAQMLTLEDMKNDPNVMIEAGLGAKSNAWGESWNKTKRLIYQNTKEGNYFHNYFAANIDEAARDRMIKEMEQRIQQIERRTVEWMQNAQNAVIMKEHDNLFRATAKFEQEKYSQWTPF